MLKPHANIFPHPLFSHISLWQRCSPPEAATWSSLGLMMPRSRRPGGGNDKAERSNPADPAKRVQQPLIFKEFLEKTSIHGLSHIESTGRSYIFCSGLELQYKCRIVQVSRLPEKHPVVGHCTQWIYPHFLSHIHGLEGESFYSPLLSVVWRLESVVCRTGTRTLCPPLWFRYR